MGECDEKESCSLLKDMLAYAPDLAQETLQAYCRQDPTTCARYMVLKELGAEGVPPNILPGDVRRATELISQTQRRAADANRAL